MNKKEIPVIVLGVATTALSVQRLVAQLGHPVFAACPPKCWAARTKHYRPLPETSSGRWYGDLTDAGYQHLRELPFSRAFIIPAADDACLWLSKLPGDISDRFLVCGSETRTLEMLQDKAEFVALTSELGTPCPRSYVINCRSELANLAVDHPGDYFIKPRISQTFNKKFGVKALRFSGAREALDIWDDNDLDSIGVLVQEYIPGGADRHFFIDGFRSRTGQTCALLARQRLRMFPRDFGDSSLCKNVNVTEVGPAWESLRTLLDRVSYRGIFSAEFKLDTRDQQFKLIEINTRPWVYVQFAELCGANMCELYIQDALEEQVGQIPPFNVEKYCVNLLSDLKAIRALPATARPGFIALAKLWFVAFKVVFDGSDLKPAMFNAVDLMRSGVKRILAKG